MTGAPSPAVPSRRGQRLSCLAFALLWLCVAVASSGAGLLAVRGDVVFRHSDLRQTRIWLVQEEGNRGVGLSTTRLVSGSEGGDRACIQTTVRFFLWQSDQPSPNTAYCECYQREGVGWAYTGLCPGGGGTLGS